MNFEEEIRKNKKEIYDLKEAMNILTHKLNGIQSAITKYVEDKTL